MQWHPEEHVGVGYAMNLLQNTFDNERAKVWVLTMEPCKWS